MKNNSFVIFTGGTGGHVIPAINFGNYLIDLGYKCTIFLDNRGFKYSNKFKGKILRISSSHFSGNIFFKIRSFFYLFLGFLQSIFFLLFMRPRYCIAFGSYASSMPLLTSIFLKYIINSKIYLHEQNSVIGKVNKFFLPFSDTLFTNFSYLINLNPKYKNKVITVGLPDGNNIYKKKKVKNYKDQKITIFIYGGSQGSINLNKYFLEFIEKLPRSFVKNLNFLIQSQRNQISNIENRLKLFTHNYQVKNYFENINEILKLSDIVICRAGAGTINDIITYQIPSIIVPYPYALDDHQFYNAKYLLDNSATVLIEEKNLNSNMFDIKLKELITNFDKRLNYINRLQSIKILDTENLMLNKILEKND